MRVVPGFVEIDLVGHEGGNAVGEHAYTLTVTDIATGWTENRSVPNKARKWVVAALADIAKGLVVPRVGIGSEYAVLVIMPAPARVAGSGRESGLIRSA